MRSPVRVSVLVPTFERHEAVARLVGQLADQTMPPQEYEVIVIDDGSSRPVEPSLDEFRSSFRLRVHRSPNRGPAAARDIGARLAEGDVLVMLDDDMQVGRGFLEAHSRHHDGVGALVVLGRISPDPAISDMPIFERFHARRLTAMAEAFDAGRERPRGTHLYTGNVSVTRSAYLASGGFDSSLRRSEDRELGLRLEAAGARFAFAKEAESIHSSDHSEGNAWLKSARTYGVHDLRIARKHPMRRDADPWSFMSVVSPLARPLYVASALSPALGRVGGRAALGLSVLLDDAGLEPAALSGTTAAYGMSYFSGVGEESGGASRIVARLSGLSAGVPVGTSRRWWELVQADHECIRRYRSRYHGEDISKSAIFSHLREKVGLQMMAFVRLIEVFRESGHLLAAKTLSRLLRHLYGADIHWEARISPGVMIVHGMGLCIAKGARVGPGCILFQNVTIGEGAHPESRQIGAPTLEENVHLGPGATIVGPVTIGASSKVMAGVTLTHSVQPGSLVEAPKAAVQPRPKISAPRRSETQPGARWQGAPTPP